MTAPCNDATFMILSGEQWLREYNLVVTLLAGVNRFELVFVIVNAGPTFIASAERVAIGDLNHTLSRMIFGHSQSSVAARNWKMRPHATVALHHASVFRHGCRHRPASVRARALVHHDLGVDFNVQRGRLAAVDDISFAGPVSRTVRANFESFNADVRTYVRESRQSLEIEALPSLRCSRPGKMKRGVQKGGACQAKKCLKPRGQYKAAARFHGFFAHPQCLLIESVGYRFLIYSPDFQQRLGRSGVPAMRRRIAVRLTATAEGCSQDNRSKRQYFHDVATIGQTVISQVRESEGRFDLSSPTVAWGAGA